MSIFEIIKFEQALLEIIKNNTTDIVTIDR